MSERARGARMMRWVWRFLLHWRMRFLYLSAVLTLIGLALMCWSVIDPRPLPVVVAMSVGQVIGTAAFAMFGAVIFLDLWRAKIPHEHVKPPPAEPPPDEQPPAEQPPAEGGG